ncbi:hypothetical protein PG996_009561 [Apiospora saccharicola]|uniref:NAD/GMP synthase domain-containing protein n=1 Tax=Apiospora saccharicola TaxID=335842 RepID=A0ABR1UNM6_9PEZI
MILLSGKTLEQGSQFSLEPVEVITATIDLEEIRSYRSSISRNVQAAQQADSTRVEWDIRLSQKELHILDPMTEIWMGTSVYLWQYLVRTSSPGFFLSLSGGLDSSTVALFVYGMPKVVLKSIEAGSKTTLADLRRVTGMDTLVPKTPEEIVGLFANHMLYLYHQAVQASMAIINEALHFTLKYAVEGGTRSENLALQNIQARSRITTQYMLAQLVTTASQSPRAGSPLLGLASGNVDENLRGYYTKYDASSGDLAPLGSISKNNAKLFQSWAMKAWDLPILEELLTATPSAEPLPLPAGVQDDESESEMGLMYTELSTFGILRKMAEKVMHFFRNYAINRHNATITTPSVHMSAYNPDDNRHDLRPFLYNVNWPFQFNKIRAHAEHLQNMMSK